MCVCWYHGTMVPSLILSEPKQGTKEQPTAQATTPRTDGKLSRKRNVYSGALDTSRNPQKGDHSRGRV